MKDGAICMTISIIYDMFGFKLMTITKSPFLSITVYCAQVLQIHMIPVGATILLPRRHQRDPTHRRNSSGEIGHHRKFSGQFVHYHTDHNGHWFFRHRKVSEIPYINYHTDHTLHLFFHSKVSGTNRALSQIIGKNSLDTSSKNPDTSCLIVRYRQTSYFFVHNRDDYAVFSSYYALWENDTPHRMIYTHYLSTALRCSMLKVEWECICMFNGLLVQSLRRIRQFWQV